MHDFNLLEEQEALLGGFAPHVRVIAQRISFDVDVTGEDPLLVAAAKILLTDYVPTVRPTKDYAAPHIPFRVRS